MAKTITLPAIGTYVKVKKNVENRDAILNALRGHYGTSTKKAFKVLGYYMRDNKSVGLILEDAWGGKVFANGEKFSSI